MIESDTSRFHYGVMPVIIFPLVGFLIYNAFSFKVRRAILDRDRACVDAGNGICLGDLQAAHDNHDRSSEAYDSLDNGHTKCVRHHYIQHLLAMNNPESIGMSKQGNSSAIRHLRSQLAEAILFKSEDAGLINTGKYFEP